MPVAKNCPISKTLWSELNIISREAAASEARARKCRGNGGKSNESRRSAIFRITANKLRNLLFLWPREPLPQLSPLLSGEQPRPHFDEARRHIEQRYPVPRLPVPHPKALFVQVTYDAGIRKVLHQQLHHRHEHSVLCGVNLQPLAVVRDAESIRDILAERAFGRSLRFR